MTELIIWGIRQGFESKPMYCSNTSVLSGFSTLMQDATYRSLSQNIRPKNAFILHCQGGYNYLSLIYTDIREYRNQIDPRWGYVVFTLAIPNSMSFGGSPLYILLEIAEFYKTCVGQTNTNNFTDEQVRTGFLNRVSVQNRGYSSPFESGYTYFNHYDEIFSWMSFDKAYFNFQEFLFLPEDSESKYENYGFDGKHKLTNLSYLEAQFIESEEIKRKKLHEESLVRLEVQQKQDQIWNLINTGQVDFAINEFGNYPLKERLDYGLKNKVEDLRNQKANEEILKNKKLDDENNVGQIKLHIKNQDWKSAIALYQGLNDKSSLDQVSSSSIIKKIDEIRKEKDLELEKQKNVYQSKVRRKKSIIISSFSALIVFSMVLAYLKFNKPPIDPNVNNLYASFRSKDSVLQVLYKSQDINLAKLKDNKIFSLKSGANFESLSISHFNNPFSTLYSPNFDSLQKILNELKSKDSIDYKYDSIIKARNIERSTIEKKINKLNEISEVLKSKKSNDTTQNLNYLIFYIVTENGDSVNALFNKFKDSYKKDEVYLALADKFKPKVQDNELSREEIIANFRKGEVVLLDKKIFGNDFKKINNSILDKYVKYVSTKKSYFYGDSNSQPHEASSNETISDLNKIFGLNVPTKETDKEKFDQLVKQGDNFKKRKDFKKAKESYDAALKIISNDPTTKNKLNEVISDLNNKNNNENNAAQGKDNPAVKMKNIKSNCNNCKCKADKFKSKASVTNEEAIEIENILSRCKDSLDLSLKKKLEQLKDKSK